MRTFTHTSTFDVPRHALWSFHARPGAFSRLAPPWQRLRLVRWTGGIRDGGRLDFDLLPTPLPFPSLRWSALHEGFDEGRSFRDRQLRGPFAHWLHTHACEDDPAGNPARSLLRDHVELALPFGAVGNLLGWPLLSADLNRLFRWRHERTRHDLLAHARHQHRPRLRILIAGASGLIGAALAAYLANAGHTVDRLVRRPTRPVIDGTGREWRWAPEHHELDPGALLHADAVINLCGENIAARRLTPDYLARVRDSRLRTTALLARAIANRRPTPPAFLVASGTALARPLRGQRALAPDTGPATDGLDEAAADLRGRQHRAGPHPDALADIVHDWESAADPARHAGARVVHLRYGFVLALGGGALATMAPLFRAGLGGPLGDGRQAMSWIALDDALAATEHALHDDALAGPVHVVAPEPVAQRTFAQTLARVLRRPAFLPAPGPIVRAAFGPLGEAILAGEHAVPAALQRRGFRWTYPDLESALRVALGRVAPVDVARFHAAPRPVPAPPVRP